MTNRPLLTTDSDIFDLIKNGDVCRVRKGHLWQWAKLNKKQECVLCGRTRTRVETWVEGLGVCSSHSETGDCVIAEVEG